MYNSALRWAAFNANSKTRFHIYTSSPHSLKVDRLVHVEVKLRR